MVAWPPVIASLLLAPGIALDGGHVLSGVAQAKLMLLSFALLAALPLGGL